MQRPHDTLTVSTKTAGRPPKLATMAKLGNKAIATLRFHLNGAAANLDPILNHRSPVISLDMRSGCLQTTKLI